MQLLEGYVALDLTDLRGQLCGKLLRDLGMTVIKVEPPAGDPVRRLGPFAGDAPGLERSLRFAWLNAGKQSLTLDLTRPAGRDLLLRLVEQADVLLESSDPGTLDALGLGPAALRARNPRLVVTSLSGFGQDGPYRDYRCPDIVGFATGGLMYVSGSPDRPPVKGPETQANYYGSLYAALGTLLALWHRDTATAPGCHVDVAVQETIASQEHLIRAFGFDGHSTGRYGSQHATVAPANIFPTQDGYVYLFVSRPHWRLFLDAWEDHPPELDDPKWLPNHVRRAHADWLNEQVAQFTRRFTKAECARLLQSRGVPCLPVNTPSEFARDEQVQHRGLFQPTTHPSLGPYAQPAFPALLDGTRVPVAPPPLLGEHTVAILRERLGLSPTEIDLLFAEGTI
jgi:crotonobetainyl-CoA:carnitine CoA-transferase CaiB-like acyl-CoA transferase